MTVYVGPTFPCPGAVADRIGLKERQSVAHLTADTQGQMWVASADLELPAAREMGQESGSRFRCIITTWERNLAVARGAVQLTASEMYALQASRSPVG